MLLSLLSLVAVVVVVVVVVVFVVSVVFVVVVVVVVVFVLLARRAVLVLCPRLLVGEGVERLHDEPREFCEPGLRYLSAQFVKFCGDLRRSAETGIFLCKKDQQVPRRFAETMNPRKDCADKCQNPGS